MSRTWLSNSDTLIVSKPLAKAVGINGSIALCRVEHWLEYNQKHKRVREATHFQDGRWWTRNGYKGWEGDLEIFPYSTIRRTFNRQEELRLLISTDKYNRNPKDQTKWWSIDYEKYDEFIVLWQHCGSPIFNDGNRQSKNYSAFIQQWKAYLALKTLLTVSRVCQPIDPAHGEQGGLLTVDRGAAHGEQGGLLTVDRGAAHGEQGYPRESSDESESDESTDQSSNQGEALEETEDAVPEAVDDDDEIDIPENKDFQDALKHFNTLIPHSKAAEADREQLKKDLPVYGLQHVIAQMDYCHNYKKENGQKLTNYAYVHSSLVNKWGEPSDAGNVVKGANAFVEALKNDKYASFYEGLG